MAILDAKLRQHLRELLAPYGEVKSLHILSDGTGSECLILATMESAACVLAAQAALGLHSFGTDSLLIGEHWLRNAVNGD